MLAADQPHLARDMHLLVHETVRLVIREDDGGVAHVPMAAQRDGVNRDAARPGKGGGFEKIGPLEIMPVRQQHEAGGGFADGEGIDHRRDGTIDGGGCPVRLHVGEQIRGERRSVLPKLEKARGELFVAIRDELCVENRVLCGLQA